MKKLIVIAIALFTLQMNAQERREKGADRPDFTSEEMAQLQTKKMTLELDLTEVQQREVAKINLKNAQERKSKKEEFKNKKEKSDGEKPSKDAILKMKNEMLDSQIANKKKMKEILNEKQFEKWEKHQGKRQAMHGKKKKMKREHGERGERKQQREHKD